jgi:hypothetical protein
MSSKVLRATLSHEMTALLAAATPLLRVARGKAQE